MFKLHLATIAFAMLSCGAPTRNTATSSESPPAGGPSRGTDVPADGAASDMEPRERLVHLFTELKVSIGEKGKSCDEFTTTLARWLQTYGDEIRDLLIMDLPDSDHEKIEESITDTATEVVSAASDCGSSDEAFTAYNEWDALVL